MHSFYFDDPNLSFPDETQLTWHIPQFIYSEHLRYLEWLKLNEVFKWIRVINKDVNIVLYKKNKRAAIIILPLQPDHLMRKQNTQCIPQPLPKCYDSKVSYPAKHDHNFGTEFGFSRGHTGTAEVWAEARIMWEGKVFKTEEKGKGRGEDRTDGEMAQKKTSKLKAWRKDTHVAEWA